MSAKTIVTEMIADAPPGNTSAIIKDIKTIVAEQGSRQTIEEIVRDYHVEKNYKLVKVGDKGLAIVSKYTQDGVKFFDPILNVKFDYDFNESKVVDVEPANGYSQVSSINTKLTQYVEDHFPTFAKGVAVRDGSELHVVIVDEDLNDGNFYNGQWQSQYTLNGTRLTGQIKVRVHYYEDGNVSLKTGTQVSETGVTEQSLIETISKVENQFELDILKRFTNLNEEQFKNLRRQLPMNRTKIQWGKAIRTYKLGQYAVDGRN